MKKIFEISFFLLLNTTILAQERGHYLFLNAGGGLHSIKYKIENGTVSRANGFAVNSGYDYFFNKNWGVGAGVSLFTHSSSSTFTYMTEEASVDSDGDNFSFRTYYNNWKEKQRLLSLDVPVALSFQKKIGNKVGVLALIGAKASLPMVLTSESNGESVETRGYYKQWEVELYGMPQHNFLTVKGVPRTDVPSRLFFTGFIDLGATYKISKKLYAYGGVYYNYGLTEIVDGHGKDIYAQDGVYNGVMVSDFASKVITNAIGVKLGVRIHLGPQASMIINDVDRLGIVAQPNKQVTDTTKNETDSMKDSVSDSTSSNKAIAQGQSTIKTKDDAPKTPKYAPIVLEDTDKLNDASDSVYEMMNINDIDNMTEDEVYYIARLLASKIKPKFAFASDEVLNPQADIYKVLAEVLIRRKDIHLLIVGHTCDIGSQEANIKMGMKRAAKMQQLFENLGVNVIQLPTISKFYSEPLVPNTSEENRAKNRRVELFVE